MARPLLPIRPDQVVFLARRGMSVVEIAGFFDCDRGTLYKRFGAELRSELDRAVRGAGFEFCALDMQGFASGRMNVLLGMPSAR